ncbi:uncharacterized protein I206_103261 [Kwoniella pini CBS 10737]|uniref:Uncharacterized protein n=1 Tax=Kwoniella pini CBS 10737 TaxID=1296096 RepID=A0A1B9IAE1_9TREE|nr:uncharacterized protein I206_01733 [Kwoniella pini CBS 10737]OCF52443.1 hypothetical protein I206_01733 [Kwoniella pini CBS 10737]
MKFTFPLFISLTIFSTFVISSPTINNDKFKLINRESIPPIARNNGIYLRQNTGDANTSNGDNTVDTSTSTETETEDSNESTSSTGTEVEATPTYTYNGSGGEAGDSGPALTATESGSTPAANDLTSATAAGVEATSADPNAQPSSAPSTSTSHSGLTNYNTTTRSQSQSLVGTSAAQTTGSAKTSSTSSSAKSGALPLMPNLHPLSLITVILAGGLGVIRVLF